MDSQRLIWNEGQVITGLASPNVYVVRCGKKFSVLKPSAANQILVSKSSFFFGQLRESEYVLL